jgi:hypothetical protein
MPARRRHKAIREDRQLAPLCRHLPAPGGEPADMAEAKRDGLPLQDLTKGVPYKT